MRISDWSSDVCSSDLLAEVAGAGTGEPAAEALRPRDAKGGAAGLDGHRGALEHGDAPGGELVGDPLGAPGVVVVVAEHGDDRDLEPRHGLGDEHRLLELAVAGAVAGEQPDVGGVVDRAGGVAEGADVVGAEVEVPACLPPDYRSPSG